MSFFFFFFVFRAGEKTAGRRRGVCTTLSAPPAPTRPTPAPGDLTQFCVHGDLPCRRTRASDQVGCGGGDGRAARPLNWVRAQRAKKHACTFPLARACLPSSLCLPLCRSSTHLASGQDQQARQRGAEHGGYVMGMRQVGVERGQDNQHMCGGARQRGTLLFANPCSPTLPLPAAPILLPHARRPGVRRRLRPAGGRLDGGGLHPGGRGGTDLEEDRRRSSLEW